MAYIDNSETKKELDEAIRGNAQSNISPNQIANQVIPVIDINPKHARRANISIGTSRTTSGGLTIYTTPADKDFYLTHVTYSIIKDATCDLASGESTLSGFVNGASVRLLNIAVLTTTAQNSFISTDFSIPIKIDRNTAITTSSTAHTAGSKVVAATIQGYTVEP